MPRIVDTGGGYGGTSKPKPTSKKGPLYSLTDPNATYRAKNYSDAVSRGLIRSVTAKKAAAKPKPTDHPSLRGTKTATYKPTTGGGKRSAGVGTVKSTPTAAKKATPSKSTSSSSSSSTATNPYTKQAKDAVAAELDPKIKAIKDTKSQYDVQSQTEQNKNIERTKQTSHDIGYLYSNLDSKLKSQQSETDAAYTNAASQVDANYGALINKLKNATNQSVDKVNSEAARLGLIPPTESRAGADGGFAQDLAATNRQNAALMIGAQAQNNKSTGGFIQQAEQGLGVQKTTDFTAQQNNALNSLVSDQRAQDTKYGNDILNLESQRSTMEQQYMQQLEQQAYNRAQEASQQAFMNSLAVGKFNLSQDTFTANQEYRKAQLALEQQKIQQAAQKASSGSGTTLHLTDAANYLTSKTAGNPALSSALNYAFQTAMNSGEYDFGNPADKEKSLNGLRKALMYKDPTLNNDVNMTILANALNAYLGISVV